MCAHPVPRRSGSSSGAPASVEGGAGRARGASLGKRVAGSEPLTRRGPHAILIGDRSTELDAMKRFLCLGTLTLALAAAPAGAAPERAPRAGGADALYAHALRLLERNSIDARRVAIRDLEQATLIRPSNPDYQLTLARAYFQAGFLKSARTRFER